MKHLKLLGFIVLSTFLGVCSSVQAPQEGQGYFEPARTFYKRFGFSICAPFARYVEDPGSIFMSKET